MVKQVTKKAASSSLTTFIHTWTVHRHVSAPRQQGPHPLRDGPFKGVAIHVANLSGPKGYSRMNRSSRSPSRASSRRPGSRCSAGRNSTRRSLPPQARRRYGVLPPFLQAPSNLPPGRLRRQALLPEPSSTRARASPSKRTERCGRGRAGVREMGREGEHRTAWGRGAGTRKRRSSSPLPPT